MIHCGGPFSLHSQDDGEACLATGTHYTGITGEYLVFLNRFPTSMPRPKLNITIMPGTGFDVVPSDCLALHLKTKLPTATHLQLAFTMSKGGLSRGTSKSMTEGLGEVGHPKKMENSSALNWVIWSKEVDFGSFQVL